MNNQRGSFLVICLVMMTLILILSFAVVHTISTEVDVSTSNQRYLLAEQTAQSGFDHAVAQILIDYGSKTYTLAQHSAAGSGLPSVVTVPAITFLDGQYRAPFTAINYPNSLAGNCDTNNPATNDNDVRMEDYVLRPWAWWWFDVNAPWNGGLFEYDGKGRYYEPGYYNNQPMPVVTGSPVTATPFLNLNASLPQLSQGMFYDEQYRRVYPSNGPVLDRANARYRLRYTVGVEDLQGHLLIDPMPDMQMLSGPQFGAVDYRTPGASSNAITPASVGRYPWMMSAANALAAIAGSASSSGTYSCQLEHVFMGRGYHTNVDFDHTATGVNGNGLWPKTFPLEYRNHPDPGGTGSWESYLDGASQIATASAASQPNMVTNQLYYSSNGQVKGLAIGGETIPVGGVNASSNFWPYPDGMYMHCLMGPQLSFQEASYAAHGETAYLGGEGGGGSRALDNFGLTPFGRCLVAASYVPGQRKWYQGHVSTPFYMNVMTTPPALINAMLMGYLPPADKITVFTSVTWYSYVGAAPGGGTIYNTILTEPISPDNAYNWGTGYGRDLLVSTTSPPAFAQWQPPTRSDSNLLGAQNPPGATGIGQTISPDYSASDTRLQQGIWPYPGIFMQGNSAVTGQGSDNLGALMDEASLSPGIDLNTHGAFGSLPSTGSSGRYWYYYGSQYPPLDPRGLALAQNWATVAPPPGWGANPSDEAGKSQPSATDSSYRGNSYFLDLVASMGMAIAVLRAEYTEYGYPNWIGTSGFFGKGASIWPQSDPNPSNYETLHDLDRLFLAEMGESISAPGTGNPKTLNLAKQLIAYRYNGYYSNPLYTSDYVPKNNIWSLNTGNLIANNDGSVSSLQRAHVMSLLLNDFRMSFLGSSPDYSDGIDPNTGLPNPALQFMPLDFVGDGTTYCSCYAGTDKDGLPCAADGTAPPCYFTITGNFFMGKSHFYRIFSRGEVWDNVLNKKLDNATLDSVIAVDPEGGNPLQTQTLYQRWAYNRYDGMAPTVRR